MNSAGDWPPKGLDGLNFAWKVDDGFPDVFEPFDEATGEGWEPCIFF